jgi:hypothetical protein
MTAVKKPVSRTKAPPKYYPYRWTIIRVNGKAYVEQGRRPTKLIYTTPDTGQTDMELMQEASALYKHWLA